MSPVRYRAPSDLCLSNNFLIFFGFVVYGDGHPRCRKKDAVTILALEYSTVNTLDNLPFVSNFLQNNNIIKKVCLTHLRNMLSIDSII